MYLVGVQGKLLREAESLVEYDIHMRFSNMFCVSSLLFKFRCSDFLEKKGNFRFTLQFPRLIFKLRIWYMIFVLKSVLG